MYLPELSSFLESRVEICSDYPFIELGTSDILHAIQSILMRVVLNKAEPTWCFIEPIQAHYQSLDLPTSIKHELQRRLMLLMTDLAKSSWICSSVV